MKNLQEIYKKWFNGEENIIIIHEEETSQLIIGVEEDTISIAYIMNIMGNFHISIDRQLNIGRYINKCREPKHVLYTVEEVYKILFNLILVMNTRNIQHQFNVNTLDDILKEVKAECDMEFMRYLLISVKNNCLN